MRPTPLPTQKSTAATDCSLVPSPELTEVVLRRIAVLSNVPVPTGVIIVEDGIVTLTAPTGLNTTFEPVPIVTESAAVADPEIVETVPSDPQVTVTLGFCVQSYPYPNPTKYP